MKTVVIDNRAYECSEEMVRSLVGVIGKLEKRVSALPERDITNPDDYLSGFCAGMNHGLSFRDPGS